VGYVVLKTPTPQDGWTSWVSKKASQAGSAIASVFEDKPKTPEEKLASVAKKRAKEAEHVAQQQAIFQQAAGQRRAQTTQLLIAGGAVLGVVGLALLFTRRKKS